MPVTPSQQIDSYLNEFDDWRGVILSELRQLIVTADPKISEELKWGVPVFTHRKMICAISGFKAHVKINFFHGASLKDAHKLFNNGFDSKHHRSIDFYEGAVLDEKKLKDLIDEAINHE